MSRYLDDWYTFEMLNKITAILEDKYSSDRLGHCYVTSYQLALDYTELHPDDVANLAILKGQEGTKRYYVLANYFSQALGWLINTKGLVHIERAHLYSYNISQLSFIGEDIVLDASEPESVADLVMYRLRALI